MQLSLSTFSASGLFALIKSLTIAKLLADEIVPFCGVPEALLTDSGEKLVTFDVGPVRKVGEKEPQHYSLPSTV